MPAKETLVHRLNVIMAQLGAQAYERQGHVLSIAKIDEQVAQMEAQKVLIEATLNEVTEDERIALATQQKEREDEREKRSARAKAAAKKRKRQTAKEKEEGHDAK
jgi:hypothetical protein